MKEIADAIEKLEALQADPATKHVNNERAILRLQQAQALVDERDLDAIAKVTKRRAAAEPAAPKA